MPVKKTTKKAAKKTYPPAKKAFPKRRVATLEELYAVMAEIDARYDARFAKTEAAIESLTAAQAKTEASIDRLFAAQARLSVSIDRLSVPYIRDWYDICELMDLIVIPNIRLAMNTAGKHNFDSILTDRLFKKIDELGEQKILTDVTVFLSGDTEAMAIEINEQPKIHDVELHLERLEILRQHEDLVGIKCKKLFGAMVGAIIDRDVKNFALERGLYVVKIREEEEKLDVAEPETRGTW